MPSPSTAQIALWSQRRIRSKLHLPFCTAEVLHFSNGSIDYSASLDTLRLRPVCARHLNNHREERSQQGDRMEFAGSLPEFTYQLLSGKGCKHCAKASGLLVSVTEISRSEEEEQEDDQA